MDKYKDTMHHKGSFSGVSNIYYILITCEDKIVIPEIIQSYVLHWYHMYILCTGIDRTEGMIFQYLYWTGIRNAVWKEVNNCDTCQRMKRLNIEYGQLISKKAEEIPCTKICVYLIWLYVIQRKGQK